MCPCAYRNGFPAIPPIPSNIHRENPSAIYLKPSVWQSIRKGAYYVHTDWLSPYIREKRRYVHNRHLNHSALERRRPHSRLQGGLYPGNTALYSENTSLLEGKIRYFIHRHLPGHHHRLHWANSVLYYENTSLIYKKKYGIALAIIF